MYKHKEPRNRKTDGNPDLRYKNKKPSVVGQDIKKRKYQDDKNEARTTTKVLGFILLISMSVAVGMHTGNELTKLYEYLIETRQQVKALEAKERSKNILRPVIDSCVANCDEEIVESDNRSNSVDTDSTIGVASYYSEDGCVGCRDDLLMANGYKFRDSGLTVAYNRVALGSFVRITNLANNEQVIAEVTDTGGFEELGRIIDLSPAVKDLIECTDLCDVKVEVL